MIQKDGKTKKSNAGRKWFDGKDEEEVLSKLREAWALDCTDVESFFYADISEQSYYRYLKAHPELREERDRLKETPVFKARKTVIDKIGESYANAMDYLKRKRKDEFGDKQEVDLGVKPELKEALDKISKILPD